MNSRIKVTPGGSKPTAGIVDRRRAMASTAGRANQCRKRVASANRDRGSRDAATPLVAKARVPTEIGGRARKVRRDAMEITHAVPRKMGRARKDRAMARPVPPVHATNAAVVIFATKERKDRVREKRRRRNTSKIIAALGCRMGRIVSPKINTAAATCTVKDRSQDRRREEPRRRNSAGIVMARECVMGRITSRRIRDRKSDGAVRVRRGNPARSGPTSGRRVRWRWARAWTRVKVPRPCRDSAAPIGVPSATRCGRAVRKAAPDNSRNRDRAGVRRDPDRCSLQTSACLRVERKDRGRAAGNSTGNFAEIVARKALTSSVIFVRKDPARLMCSKMRGA